MDQTTRLKRDRLILEAYSRVKGRRPNEIVRAATVEEELKHMDHGLYQRWCSEMDDRIKRVTTVRRVLRENARGPRAPRARVASHDDLLRGLRKEHYTYLRDHFFGPAMSVRWLEPAVESLISNGSPIPEHLSSGLLDLLESMPFRVSKGHMQRATADRVTSLPDRLERHSTEYRAFRHELKTDVNRSLVGFPDGVRVLDGLGKVPSEEGQGRPPTVLREGVLAWTWTLTEEAVSDAVHTGNQLAFAPVKATGAEPNDTQHETWVFSNRRDVLALCADAELRRKVMDQMVQRVRSVLERIRSRAQEFAKTERDFRAEVEETRREMKRVLEELDAGIHSVRCEYCSNEALLKRVDG